MAYDLSGFTTINGTAASETLSGDSAKNAIYGNGGTDRLFGGSGVDVLFGGSGGGVTFVFAQDATWSGASAKNVGDPGGAGTGVTFSLANFARSYDVFVGSGSNNTVEMGDGKRALFFEDTLSPGVDVYRLHNIQNIVMGSGGQIVDLTSTVKDYGSVTVTGGSGDDVILSNSGADVLSGGDGSDKVWGGSGHDRLLGGAGNDLLEGGTGNDVLDGGTGNDQMKGGVGNDTYVVDASSDVVVELAGQGTDNIHSSISFTLVSNVENLVLTGSASSGTGNTLDNTIRGNSEANTIDGVDGNDTLSGGNGNDRLIGGAGNDTLLGEAGNDILFGGVDNDNLNGGAGTDTLRAGTGDDYLFGGGGDDRLEGEAGNDRLWGDGGNDVIIGGAGDDIMKGGDFSSRYPAGNDTFGWSKSDIVNTNGSQAGFDRIVDFGPGDTLDFSLLFPGTDPGPISDMVKLAVVSGSTIVSVNLGSGFVDVVQLDGVKGLNLNAMVANGWLVT